MEALQARRFYSTRIDGVALSFQCNGQEMGSVLLAGRDISCTIDVTSGHQQSFTWVELVKNGNVVRSIPSPTFPLTKRKINTVADDYIYAILWQGNVWKVITSPIFFTGMGEPS